MAPRKKIADQILAGQTPTPTDPTLTDQILRQPPSVPVPSMMKPIQTMTVPAPLPGAPARTSPATTSAPVSAPTPTPPSVQPQAAATPVPPPTPAGTPVPPPGEPIPPPPKYVQFSEPIENVGQSATIRQAPLGLTGNDLKQFNDISRSVAKRWDAVKAAQDKYLQLKNSGIADVGQFGSFGSSFQDQLRGAKQQLDDAVAAARTFQVNAEKEQDGLAALAVPSSGTGDFPAPTPVPEPSQTSNPAEDAFNEFIKQTMAQHGDISPEEEATIRRDMTAAKDRALSNLSARGMGVGSGAAIAETQGQFATEAAVGQARQHARDVGMQQALQAAGMSLEHIKLVQDKMLTLRDQDIQQNLGISRLELENVISGRGMDLAKAQMALQRWSAQMGFDLDQQQIDAGLKQLEAQGHQALTNGLMTMFSTIVMGLTLL